MIPKYKGFTLIEVLIGLAILSIALTALLIITGQNIQQTQRVKQTLVSHWIAEQAIKEIQLGIIPLPTSSFITYKTQWLNQDLFWKAQIKKTSIKKIKSITILTSTKQSGPFRPNLTGYWMLE